MPNVKQEGTWAEEKVSLTSEAEPDSQYPEQLLWTQNLGTIYYNRMFCSHLLRKPEKAEKKGRKDS